MQQPVDFGIFSYVTVNVYYFSYIRCYEHAVCVSTPQT